ncbi:MAG TPA: NAD-glutamate dehydrogenase [Solirubrobacteraceae bacterium]|nr:NAD-glutamate dehydrogenase [Solirubrobacteraceae bacterium]
MAVKAAELEAELIDAVCARLRERLPQNQASRCDAFVRQYYHWVPPDDLAGRSSLDLYGAALTHWNLLQRRAPGEIKVHVYNPDFEHHGWQSSHTVAEIVTDDMPFLVDSVTMELARMGYAIDLVIHPVIRVRRDKSGSLVDVLEPGADASDALAESVLHAEVARDTDGDALEQLRAGLERVLGEVHAAVADWRVMRGRAESLIGELDEHEPPLDPAEIQEAKAFLAWLADNHFTFLGYREYELEDSGGRAGLRAIRESGLGILRGDPRTPYTELGPKALTLARAPHILVLTKANSRATVHRPAYLDYVGVKRFGPGGEVTGERRFLGLYTTAAYKTSAREIPQLRGKIGQILSRAGFPPDSHDAKALFEILESYPRDSLFQVDLDELFEVAIGILSLGERQRVRLFVTRDMLDRFVECLVCIPRDRFNTENRERVARILVEQFGGTHVDWTIQLSESLLARVHYIVHCPDGVPDEFDVAALESQLVRATRAWSDDLRAALGDEQGEDSGGRLYKRYERAFPPAYRDDWVARSAVADIARIEDLAGADEPIMSLYRPLEAPEGIMRCKLFSADGVLLSDVLPTFEHMGARVVDERPYEIAPASREHVWIYDFGLQCVAEDVDRVRSLFQDAFLGVWRGELEDDRFNALVLRAALTGEQIVIIRAVAKYLRQAGIAFSDRYMERTILAHPEVTVMLVGLFAARFHPEQRDSAAAERLVGEIEDAIDAVQSLDEDRILRSFLAVIRAMLRTNYYRVDDAGRPRPFLSFKLDPSLVPVLPLPRPRFEIFVYSPRVEGVHLRGGRVARGGLRWSDRREDFRTEVLGLMKAQMVKNALIVPVGSKGGFVLKRPPADGGRDALQREAIACYRTFLCGLLDITDNIVAGDVVAPDRVVRYDDDDPYLVVAADKGTATFSDIANEVSSSYGFWLGDAFASGGSQGYDHKQMGITARGAWESVKRHFRELGTDIQRTDFTVVGIGDMSGDVFGNGMLLSRHIKLLAAFNHMHIFLDPDPDPERSHAERKRVFELERSSWSDYDSSVISEGGGVYSRSAKSIPISEQVREALAIECDELSPNELIREVLRAPVDLLWNGGIGTYVKASTETHADAGDKANDAVRLDGAELRCRVVGEGGNLGWTQRGRIEYALNGGRINTDAIDNVAGVNCSDHEVNIKILLDALVAEGDMTEKQRNELLVEMTDAVAEQVLYGSYTQTQALSLALAQAPPMLDVHARLIRHLEQVAGLNRELEFLPDDDMLAERRSSHIGLLAPELAVVMAYCKIHLYALLLESDLPEDPYLAHDLERYFPPPLPERYSRAMRSHRLRREIIVTLVAKQLVDRAGTTFVFRLQEETGAPPSILARGYAVAREVFDMRSFWSAVEALDNAVDAEIQVAMLIEARKLVERATRWLVHANPRAINIAQTTHYYKAGATMLAALLPDVLEGAERDRFDARADELRAAGVPSDLARRVAGMAALLATFDIVEVAAVTEQEPETVMETYFHLGARLELNWLREQILELPRENRWQALARGALRDDLGSLHRALTQEVLGVGPPGVRSSVAIDAWSRRNGAAIERCLGMLADIKASRTYDTTTLPVALREVRNLIRGGRLATGPAGAESVTHAG